MESQIPPPILEVEQSRHIVYILKSLNPSYPQRTYVGYTVDLGRRIRQHNGIIVGGAKYTRIGRPYGVAGYIEGFPNNNNALKFEWRCHNPGGKTRDHKKIQARFRRYKGMDRRIRILEYVLSLERWTNTAIDSKTFSLTINWLENGIWLNKIPDHHHQYLLLEYKTYNI